MKTYEVMLSGMQEYVTSVVVEAEDEDDAYDAAFELVSTLSEGDWEPAPGRGIQDVEVDTVYLVRDEGDDEEE